MHFGGDPSATRPAPSLPGGSGGRVPDHPREPDFIVSPDGKVRDVRRKQPYEKFAAGSDWHGSTQSWSGPGSDRPGPASATSIPASAVKIVPPGSERRFGSA